MKEDERKILKITSHVLLYNKIRTGKIDVTVYMAYMARSGRVLGNREMLGFL